VCIYLRDSEARVINEFWVVTHCISERAIGFGGKYCLLVQDRRLKPLATDGFMFGELFDFE
jgi:hypothetical protein